MIFRPKEDKRGSWEMEEKNPNTGFVQPHLALVLKNGSVWDISFNDNMMCVDKKLLIQLPQGGPKQMELPYKWT